MWKRSICVMKQLEDSDMMGGKPPEPSPHKTPFIYPLDLAILDPKERLLAIWDEFTEHLEKMIFDNPISEPNGYMGPSPEYDDDWTEIEVTEDTIRDYQEKLQEIGENIQ